MSTTSAAFTARKSLRRSPPPTNADENRAQSNAEVNDAREYNCKACTASDSADNMVLCDNQTCGSWYHFGCVGVDSEIADRPWKCASCIMAEADNIPGTSKAESTAVSKRGLSAASKSSKSSKASTARRMQLELQKLEEEKCLAEKREQKEREERRKRDQEYVDKKYHILRLMEDAESDSEDEEIRSSVSVRRRTHNWIEDVKQKSNGAAEAQSVAMSRPTASGRRLEAVGQNQPQQPNCTTRQTSRPRVEANLPPNANIGVSRTNTVWRGAAIGNQQEHQQQQYTQPHCNATTQRQQQPVYNIQQQPQTNRPQQQQSSSPIQLTNCPEPADRTITRNNLAARHSFSKELQNFSGEPDEWPLFISSFERTTELCGFTDVENLIRLQRALKGKALESVRSMLIQPNCVPRVISTLKMLYGRPELIIHTLLQKIHALPPPKAEKLDSIVNFAIAVQNLCATIEASGLTTHLSNPTLLQELVGKLPPAIRLNWAIYTQTLSSDTCSLSHFSSWLYQVAEAANRVSLPASLNIDKQSSRHIKEKGFLHAHSEDVEEYSKYNNKPTERKCCICSGKCRSVSVCKMFEQLSHNAKWAAVREQRLCRRCLGKHGRQRCKAESACGKNNCVFKHHHMLHNDDKDVPVQKSEQNEEQTEGVTAHHNTNDLTRYERSESVYFRVIPVTIYGNNSQIEVCAFLDEGSSLTLLDEEVARQLNVNGLAAPLRIKWTADKHRYENDSELMDLKISGTHAQGKTYALRKVHTVKSLQLPQQSLDYENLQKEYAHLRGLPVSSYTSQRPRLLIGINNWNLGLPLKYKEGNAGEPVATKTRLGWCVHGIWRNSHLNAEIVTESCNFHVCDCEQCDDDADIQDLVRQYLYNDHLGVSKPTNLLMPVEERRALELLQGLTCRKEGRFETGLLWKYDDIELPDSFPMALKRFRSLQKRMARDPELAMALQHKIQDYLSKGYARKLSAEEAEGRSERSWYLPIFPVKNPNKPAKLRIVWDAAAKVRGMSLNSALMKGPDQLTSLVSVLYKFREKTIALCGDIMEMFHQIKIRDEDQHSQRFLWCDSSDHRPDTYVMTVMTFGATCSPACAQYVKNENAREFAKKYPAAAKAILDNHYVDDLLVSVDTPQEAVELAKDIRFVHSKGGFVIRNWMSNSSEVIQALQSSSTVVLDLNMGAELASEKVLGMWWCTSTDMFIFKPTRKPQLAEIFTGNRRPTKREVLRVLMTIFDPLGLIADFLMYLKVLLQEIWRSGTEWDEEIQDEQHNKWLKWISFLPKIESLRIPRCYITTSFGNRPEMQLHLFVDASENGYAAVAYVRCSDGSSTEVSLIGAKTRVAPLKSLSIPRLELQAATLGARLSKFIIESHSIAFTAKVFWSDSKNVLSWLRSDHRKYKPFVAFRVSEILEHSDVTEWRWVPSKNNVADEATKWCKSPEFCSSGRWFKGPSFLRLPPGSWPEETRQSTITQDELRTQYNNVHIECHENLFNVENFSNWKRLHRCSASLVRCARKWQAKVKLKKDVYAILQPKDLQAAIIDGPFTQIELQLGENILLKEAQISAYRDEIGCLSKNKSVSKLSPIYKMCPYLDENQLIRARGRIELSKDASDDLKRLIILPAKNHVTKLIIMDYHQRYKHHNHETALNEIRQRFHIAKLRAVFNSLRRTCQVCKILKAKPHPPIMSQLPLARLASFSRPFSYVGIDYFGPMRVTILRRTEKRWGVLITCLTTRAIHIEVAHSLSTDSCILALRNFMARRGTPLELHCDNGTNFHGAERELEQAYLNVDKEKLMETFTSTSTKWIFIPPGSPHMGGSWERLVRSVKITLSHILPTRHPSDELLRAALTEIENIVNSRPLTYLPISDEDEEALTPNHFLLGSSSGMKPLSTFSDDRVVMRKNWLTSQQYADGFWRRWVKEYLPNLTRRSKWFTPVKPIEVGNVVIIVDPNNPRNCWPKGRVIATKRSKDGQVRSATILTSSGVYERPAVRLAVLDVSATDAVKPTVPSGHTGGGC